MKNIFIFYFFRYFIVFKNNIWVVNIKSGINILIFFFLVRDEERS